MGGENMASEPPFPQSEGPDEDLNWIIETLQKDKEPSRWVPSNYPKITPEEAEEALQVRNMLGLSKKRWTDLKVQALQQLGKFRTQKFTDGVLLVTTFDGIDQLQRALEVGREMMDRPDKDISVGDRIAAGAMMANCAKGLKDLAAQAQALAARAGAKEQAEVQQRPAANLPPIAIQVNNYPGDGKADAEQKPTQPLNLPPVP